MGWIRHPHTTQEHRLNWRDVPYIRGRRWNLPTAWDDFFKRAVKSWKAYRTHQYRTLV